MQERERKSLVFLHDSQVGWARDCAPQHANVVNQLLEYRQPREIDLLPHSFKPERLHAERCVRFVVETWLKTPLPGT